MLVPKIKIIQEAHNDKIVISIFYLVTVKDICLTEIKKHIYHQLLSLYSKALAFD